MYSSPRSVALRAAPHERERRQAPAFPFFTGRAFVLDGGFLSQLGMIDSSIHIGERSRLQPKRQLDPSDPSFRARLSGGMFPSPLSEALPASRRKIGLAIDLPTTSCLENWSGRSD